MKFSDKSIPAGDYFVGVAGDAGQITLTGHGKDYKIPANRRPLKKTIRSSQVQFYPSGGASWSIVVTVPPKFEWVAFLLVDETT